MAGCGELASVCSLQPDEVRRYAACLDLLLDSGTLLLEGTATRLAAADAEPACQAMLGTQAAALTATMLAPRGASSPAAASSLPSPPRFLRWFRAVVAALEACERVRSRPGGWPWLPLTSADGSCAARGQQAAFRRCCCGPTAGAGDPAALDPCAAPLALSATSSPLGAALEEDAALCWRLARQLLPHLAAHTIGLQLPEERRPPGCSWAQASRLAGCMACLCAASPGAAVAASGSIPCILQLAAQLAARAPAGDQLTLVLQLLAVAAALYITLWQPRHELTPQQEAQPALRLLPTLPRFGVVLEAASAVLQAAESLGGALPAAAAPLAAMSAAHFELPRALLLTPPRAAAFSAAVARLVADAARGERTCTLGASRLASCPCLLPCAAGLPPSQRTRTPRPCSATWR